MKVKHFTESTYGDSWDGGAGDNSEDGFGREAGADKFIGWTADAQVSSLLGTISESGNVSEFKSLVKANPCVFEDAAVRGVNTPLHVAARRGHVGLVKEIMNLRPALAERLNLDGLTPVHLAVESGHVEVVKELLSRNPGLYRVRDCHGRTPLHYGAARGKDRVVQALIEFSSSKRFPLENDGMELVTHRGETALHLAARNQHKGVFQILTRWLQKPYGDAKIRGELGKKISCRMNRIMFELTDKAGNTVVQLAHSNNMLTPNQSSRHSAEGTGYCGWDELPLVGSWYEVILVASSLLAAAVCLPSLWIVK